MHQTFVRSYQDGATVEDCGRKVLALSVLLHDHVEFISSAKFGNASLVQHANFIAAPVLQGDIYNVPMAGRYGTEDDDEYADADISLFDDDDGDDSGGPDPVSCSTAAAASLAPRSHTIDAARGFLGGNVADEDDLEQQAHNDAALAAAAEVGGLGNDTVSGAPGILPGEQLVNQMAELRLMEATTVDEDDEVVTGDEAGGAHGIQDRPLRGGAAVEATEVVEEVEEEEEEEEGREESGVTANWWKIPAPEVPEADVPPPEAEAAAPGGSPGADAVTISAGAAVAVPAAAGRDGVSGAAAMVVEEDAAAAAVEAGPEDAAGMSSVAVVEEELVPGATNSHVGSGQASGAS